MSGGSLTPLQWKTLEILGGLEPPWTLTGGAALVGVHLKHRDTRDLDLFWHGLDRLGALPAEVRSRLEAEGSELRDLEDVKPAGKRRVSRTVASDLCPESFSSDFQGFWGRAEGFFDDR
ncbi:MAG TPA: hypothetical protein VFE33_22390 [Thermoanaerobaculia bacterium]|nr:hypothetical protein [Thermoanaerobaculia bacterium]